MHRLLIILLTLMISIAFPDAGQAAIIKMSKTGICHDPSSLWYDRTRNFEAFETLRSCLSTGGRLPKTQEVPTPVSSTARSRNEAPRTALPGFPAYDRDRHFGTWIDPDGDCLNTRHELLAEISTAAVRQSGCRITRGRWNDPYTGEIFLDSSALDIDHLVPLKWAWDRGAHGWDDAQRISFANDKRNLFATRLDVNRAKGAKGPLEWLPPNGAFHCEYVTRFRRITLLYKIDVPTQEAEQIRNLQSRLCNPSN